jgi:hypothetical protein
MTTEQFNKTAFSSKTKVIYRQREYSVLSVDWTERLIAISLGNVEDMFWVSYEDVEIV